MTELKLEGLNCAQCASVIEHTLKNKDYLKEVEFSFATKKLSVESDLESTELQSMIQDVVDKIEEGIQVEFPKETEIKESLNFLEILKNHKKTLLGSLLFLFAILIPETSITELPVYILAYLLIGGQVLLGAGKNILKGKVFDENFLMSLATVGAFLLGEYSEAVAVMLFYKTGEAFQNYAVDNSRRSIESLLKIKADFANLLVNGKIEKVNPSILKIGDMIAIKAGEKVPVDASLLDDSGFFDTSALTGESLPRTLHQGDEILSGSINTGSSVKAEVLAEFKDSTVSKIMKLVEKAAANKARTEQFITIFARYYTPIIVGAATILALAPPLAGIGDLRTWISRALIFLVISCPCALVLSIPLGYFGGLGSASRKGILIRGGNFLEALNSIDTFVFDKTGTLTEGKFTVRDYTNEETLKLAALLENHSTHPIAKSIVEAFKGNIDATAISEIEEVQGLGMRGIYEHKELLVGSSSLLSQRGIAFKSMDVESKKVHVALEGKYIGSIEIDDKVKESSRNLKNLHKLRNTEKLVMLTGDQKENAHKVARELQIDEVYSELLPQDKVEHLENFKNQGKKVLFVGDGINDAPVMTSAHIGVAMGGIGSDAAIEAADMVIMSDEPSKLFDAIETARFTRKIVIQNIVFALSVKSFFLIMGAFGQTSMYEAVFADVGVALLAVLNSMRILKK